MAQTYLFKETTKTIARDEYIVFWAIVTNEAAINIVSLPNRGVYTAMNAKH